MHFETPPQSSLALALALRRRRGHRGARVLRGAFRGVASGCRRITRWIGVELSAHDHMRRLTALDDRILADIGVARHEFPALVRSAVERRRESVRNIP
jgi:uncharacterized protein YjiS (DUF1127 family)